MITSPNYPGNYYAGINYYWLITGERGRVIELTVDDVDLEQSSDCKNDFLKIYNGDSKKGTLLRTYCGKLAIPMVGTLKSTGNNMYLYFRSDDRNVKPGFKVSWKAIATVVPEGERFVVCCKSMSNFYSVSQCVRAGQSLGFFKGS